MLNREESKESFKEALLDVANESLVYITGEALHSQIENPDDINELQSRPEPTPLEIFLMKILYQSVDLFVEEFH